MSRFAYSVNLKCCLASLVILGCSMFAMNDSCRAQDQTLDELQQQWKEMESEFATKEAAIEAGEGDTDALRSEYREMVDQANELIEKIKAACLKSIETDPTDKSAIRSLMGILLNDALNEDDAEVLKIGDQLIEIDIDPRYFEVAAKADRLSIPAKEIFEELIIRQREAQADDLPRVKLVTTKGDIVVELYENQAPNTVNNFVSLVESGNYTDMLFHRVLEGFMAQTGGFKSDGSGGDGPGYSIECECYTPETRAHFSHCLSMAHAGKDTGGSQFFLTFDRTDFLDGRHTCFGRIISGNDVLDKIERTHLSVNGQEQPIPEVEKDKLISAEIIRKRDHEYKPVKVGESKAEPAAKQPPANPESSTPDASRGQVEIDKDSDAKSEDEKSADK